MSDQYKGLFSLHGGLLLFGGTAIFSHTLDLSALDITAWRCVVAAALLLGWLGLRKKTLVFNSTAHWLGLIALSVLMGLHWVTYFHSMQVSSVTTGMLALFTYPVITVLLEPVFDRTRLQLRDLLAAILVVSGVVLMTPALDPDNPVAAGVFWGILSAALFSVRNILQRRYFSAYSPVLIMGWQTFFVAAMLLPFASHQLFSLPSEQWFQLLLLGTVFTAAPHTLLANSLRYLKATSVGLISCLQPVYGTLLAAILLSEHPDFMTIAGGLLIIAAAANETLKKQPTKLKP